MTASHPSTKKMNYLSEMRRMADFAEHNSPSISHTSLEIVRGAADELERLTRELADAIIIIDTQKVRIDSEDAERDKERQNWSKETSNLVRAIEGHQRRNAELSMEIDRLRAGLREIGSGHITVSVWDRVNQILEGSPSQDPQR